MKWILFGTVVMAVTRSYKSSLKREPHEVNSYMIGPGADLSGAKANQDTTWPEGFDPEAAGVIFKD